MTPYIRGLYNQLDKLHQQIVAYQLKCKHQGVIKIPKGSTGNYDPTDDRYWYECRCGDCNKFWTENQ